MNKIINAIKKYQSIAVLTHISEDADAICSALALKAALEETGKRADVYISAPLEERLKFIGKDMIVFESEKEYPSYELCICLDSGDLDRLGERIAIFKSAGCTMNIDHHCTNPKYAEINYVIGDASSTGEIIYDLLSAAKIKITKRIAELLYSAIASDTGCFKYSCASPSTMRAAAALMEYGIDHAELCRRLFDTEERNEMQLKGYIMENIHEYFGGRLCIAAADEELFARFGVDEKNVGDLVNIPRCLKGCELAISIRAVDGKCKISFRSAGKYDVSKIAAAIGGGGHKMAAGATVGGGVNETEKMLVEALKKYML